MNKRLNITGEKYNKLIALTINKIENGETYWNCLCECGKLTIVRLYNLRNGNTKSCGCSKKRINIKHNSIHTSEYKSWTSMKDRCLNSKAINYNNYGGRGIKICPEWIESFQTFIKDMGLKPHKNYSIDRINNDGNYEPTNCKWSTNKEQSNNRRKRSKKEIQIYQFS